MPRSPRVGKSVADRNREIRQEEHRNKIVESGQLGKVFTLIDEMHELASRTVDVTDDTPDGEESNTKAIPVAQQIANKDKVVTQRMKLINKFLPDMKALELDVQATMDILEIDRTGIHDDGDDDDE